MKSTVFSVLKIVAIAMMLVWALQPAAVQASGFCYGQQFSACMGACGSEMAKCTQHGPMNTYCWCAAFPDASMAGMGCGNCITQNMCPGAFAACTGQCHATYGCQ